ncbi:hypothetical protein BV25DRAFT_1871203 [Artomyces pyxidatus]|uniref:Uncharacterized protein n=1 Tax=Artomyces pyxidatus TaxID=48021 RepID=A0ACB8SW71_9AGAM|nr:hypothetical protein BV25DRAFT_1871203 [Artomyces pyxidatus]
MQETAGNGATDSVRVKKPLRSSLKTKGPLTPPSQKANSPVASSSKTTDDVPVFSITAPTPTDFASPHFSSPVTSSTFETPVRSETSKGKRKAEEVDVTPPDHKTGHKATFAIPEAQTSRRVSNGSHAPSSYHRKRARLSSPLPSVPSRPGSAGQSPSNAHNTGTYSSRASSNVRGSSVPPAENASERDRRRSLSQVSIPISALVTPHAPSIGKSSTFHMRDPRRPHKKLETGWALRFHTEEEDGSPVHAWLFYAAFVLFPLWWIASFLPTPKTRVVGGTDTEKAVTLDDPQIEYDARSWRTRCRVMSVVSFFTYIPFIVCVAIFA